MNADLCTLRGRTALVTGGGAGIGRAIVEAYVALGARVVVAEIDASRVAELGTTLGKASAEHWVTQCDVRDDAQVAALLAQVGERYGSLDVLVNNVGDFLLNVKPFEKTTPADWDALYNVNLRHVFAVTRAAIPLLRKASAGASIINVSTIEAFRGIPFCAVYSAFKAAITGFTRSLAVELGPAGIRVNAIAPETTETEQVKPSLFIRPEYRDHIPRWTPLGRFGLPNDIAGCAVFLATELSAWVTGTTVNVDGGALAAGGFYRTPKGQWTNVPVVTDNGISL
jgi:NAD(P)-dependent dehydrogenase (short-subunit alcohol dehydrogenase family)